MVEVLFFASLREEVGRATLSLPLDQPVALPQLLARLQDCLSATACAALTAGSVRVAINQELVSGAVVVRPGDEVAFLPPVTGG